MTKEYWVPGTDQPAAVCTRSSTWGRRGGGVGEEGVSRRG